MGKENTRTLKNTYNKKSKKNSKKNFKNKDNTTTEEMKELLNSDSSVIVNHPKNNFASNKGLVQYEGELPEQINQPQMMNPMMSQMGHPQMMSQMGHPQMMGQPQMPNQMMGQMGQPQMPNFNEQEIDPLMVQQFAPVQNNQSFQSMGMPADIKAMPSIPNNISRFSGPVQSQSLAVQSQALQSGGGMIKKSIITNLANLSKTKLKIRKFVY